MAAEPPEVGASVSCTLAAGSGCVTVPGRVRWRRPAELADEEALRAFGVEFGPLSQSERRSVDELLADVERALPATEESPDPPAPSPPAPEPSLQPGAGAVETLPSVRAAGKAAAATLEVKLDSTRSALRAQAYKAEQGMRLELVLPWFNPGSVLRLAPLDGDGARDPLEGRVVNCRVQPGANGLELELLVVPCEPARRRRYAIYETPTTATPMSDEITQPIAQLTAADAAGALVVPKTRTRGTLLIALVAACAGVALIALVRPLEQRSPGAPTLRELTEAAPPRRLQDPALLLPPPLPQAAEPVPAEPSPVAEVEAAPPAPLPEVAAKPEAPVEGAAGGPAIATTIAVELSNERAPASEAATAPQPATAAPANAPIVSVTGDQSDVFVPVEGSVADLRLALWVEPLAVVADLPSGRIPLTQPRYDIKAGGVSAVSIGKNRGVTQVRVLLNALLTRYSAERAPGGIVIRMKRDLRPLPAGAASAR